MSQNTARYLSWVSILCAVMATFGVGVFLIGYKDLSFGRVATVVVLYVAAVVLAWVSRRSLAASKGSRDE
ncbi:hypothetical protein HLV37_00375 [Eggerthellaceae bacterium zg-1084]|uniref:Uncharacterized protein n=1 Tax=Berryella wangjianweii TaxID=2734634 RepID=A0A6M8J4W1_9ACTN|nr:hypothetical protein [Berryella wangjianweii]NPD30345.1 hypothetical protein [Berryella wangjianweii]NPD32648.1 hypothetical protein [Eggerthellaceae bacterium zg-997]QKF07026.1 hypothetical protein HLV38_01955 [Berryella wangjianweii]